MNWRELLVLPENLLWAWRKARKCYVMADGLYDQAELAAFELNLEAELESIRADFATWRYACAPLRLVPQPKKPSKEGKAQFRQYFQLAVRDQVAWIALANVLGPEMDKRMPRWSYGNRLYRAAWYEDVSPEEPHSKLNIGPYRHSGGNFYRHFKHSWPLYRRHISLAARRMVYAELKPSDLATGERLALEQGEGLAYLDASHWLKPTEAGDVLYAASLDLSKFYPSVRKTAIISSFATFLPGYTGDLGELIDQMLTFTVDTTGVSEETKSEVIPTVFAGPFDRIPTGLFVGGFLANVAMLPVDLDVEALVALNRNVAHFRFVDDHEVLAYDFQTLLEWLKKYSALLEKHDIGAQIEPDKYMPPELKFLLDPACELPPGDTIETVFERAQSAAGLNGRKPTQLMTRTLGQVSMLAAQDFDLLTDAGREQRLEQLEWLLLANIPDQEIRGDTRMAFAAAQIAALTPSLFRPNDKLLFAHRRLAALTKKKSDKGTDVEISELERQVEAYASEERDDWLKLLQRHFTLLFEAFVTHPEKVRLFTRMIDFCRTTGHDGFPQIAGWMKDDKDGGLRLLKCYLGSTALHVLARHLLTASTTATRLDALHRERIAAKSFISHVLAADLGAFVPTGRGSPALQFFQRDALTAITAALAIGSVELREGEPGLSKSMRNRGGKMGLGKAAQSVGGLANATGVEIGVWFHWFFSRTGAYSERAPSYWSEVADAHLPRTLPDWNSLRRYPALLPASAWCRLAEDPALLKPDDAGWLLDAARAAPHHFGGLTAETAAVESARRVLAATGDHSLSDWVSYTSMLPRSDPRQSEWTCLEIIRQIIAPLSAIDGPDADILDDLHPENIRVPEIWFRPTSDATIGTKLTWEGWKGIAQRSLVETSLPPLQDYRYLGRLDPVDRTWPKRLRPIGQLLWGLLRQSFALPAAWNIRGQERSLLNAVAGDLEGLPISSFTLAILQSCLLPRSRETSLLRQFPTLFGNLGESAADDTEFDTPIETSEQLEELLVSAQRVLELSQMTVLEHEPRQLIPVRLRHLGAFGDDPVVEAEVPA